MAQPEIQPEGVVGEGGGGVALVVYLHCPRPGYNT